MMELPKEGNINKTMLIEDVYINTSNTKIETQTHRSINSNKINNFIKALNAIRGIKDNEFNENVNSNKKNVRFSSFINLTANTTTEYDRNISENSLANANLSREENLINFINHPVEKNIEIVNNNVRKKKFNIPEPYMTSAHFPYKMNLILNPLLQKQGKIVKIVEASENEESEENEIKEKTEKLKHLINGVKIKKLDIYSTSTANRINTNNTNSNLNNKTVINSKNKCSTAYDSNNDSHNKEKIVEIRNLNFHSNPKIPKAKNILIDYINEIEPKEIRKFELEDLDEAKDINLVDYQIEGVSSAINKRLNISELDIFNLDINFDISRHENSNFNNSNNFNRKINKNSKILIVDSVLNSSNSNINSQNINSFYNNKMSASGTKNLRLTFDEEKTSNNSSFLKKRLQAPRITSLQNSAENNYMHIYSNSINMKNLSNGKLLNQAETELNTTQKRVRRKYFKSEIFDSNLKESLSLNNINNNTLKRRRENTTNKKKKVNKNLLNKFNQAEEEFEIEQIDLISEYENTESNINNSGSQILENNMENTFIEKKRINKYQTPLSKIRTQNTINEWTEIKLKNISINFSSAKKNNSRLEKSIVKSGFKNEKSGQKAKNGSLMMILDEDMAEEESIVDTVFDLEFINNLLAREFYYRPDPDYILRHPRLEVVYRSVLVEWLMELCEEFAFKRDTFHYAVNYVDRFLSKYSDISKRSLQLIGVTSLSIAAKFEEIQIPKIEDYIHSTDNSYTQEEFIATERLILKTLKWEIMPTTINTWLNWYLCQWDLYIDTIPFIKEKLIENKKDPIFFKKPDEQSYIYFRQAAQLIDLFTVDYYSLVHTSRYLVAATIFVVICKIYEVDAFLSFNINKFDFDAKFYEVFLSQRDNFLVDIYSDFLQQSFNFSFDEPRLIDALVYASKFLCFEFNYNLPLVMQANTEGIENVKFFY